MRLWSIHPKYLDTIGLTACWREALLARKVLANRTKGYKNHPQLERFKQLNKPLDGIESYLVTIFNESAKRGFHFDHSKVTERDIIPTITVNKGQLEYEFQHLRQKLSRRNAKAYDALFEIEDIEPNPLFTATEGGIENWEVRK